MPDHFGWSSISLTNAVRRLSRPTSTVTVKKDRQWAVSWYSVTVGAAPLSVCSRSGGPMNFSKLDGRRLSGPQSSCAPHRLSAAAPALYFQKRDEAPLGLPAASMSFSDMTRPG